MFKATREIAFHDRSFKVGEIVPDQYVSKRLQDLGAVIFIKDVQECGGEGCPIPEVQLKETKKEPKELKETKKERKSKSVDEDVKGVQELLVETPADADVTVTIETEE